MRKVINIVVSAAVLIILGLSSFHDVKAKDDTYDFPLNNQSEEWKDMNHAEKVKRLNIPDSILENLTTENLLEAIIHYPLFIDLLAYNTFEDGIKYVSEQFNGLDEFISRQDVVPVLLDEYAQIDINYMKEVETTSDVYIFNKNVFVESLLFTNQLQEKMSEQELIDLNIQVLQKQHQIDTEGQSHGLLNNYKRMILNIENQTSLPFQQLELVEKAKEIYNIQESETIVRTPAGSLVPAKIYGELLSAEEKTEYQNQVITTYSDVKIISEATTNYNCHSYAWYQKSTANRIWIPSAKIYLTDGSAVRTNSITSNITRVLYGYPDPRHSGICISNNTNNNILSKWGLLPLVEHTWANSPYYLAPELLVYFNPQF